MRFTILTLFPEAIEPYLAASILGRAREAGHLTTKLVNIRDFARDTHKTVDDTPYGGGAGMVMKIEPIDKALRALNDQAPMTKNRRIVVLSARGEPFTQAKAHEYASLDELVLICGRYEGIDQRVADHLADEELSLGPYVLAGGEIAALAVLEATARLIPGVLGNEESLVEESFTSTTSNLKLTTSIEYPQYTKPADYKGWQVPDVLLSGNHAEIAKWRKQQRHND